MKRVWANPNLLFLLGAFVLLTVMAVQAQTRHAAPLTKQQHASARLIALWTDWAGKEDMAKASMLTKKSVQQVLTAGADINATSRNGETTLMAVCDTENSPVANLLVSKGANVNARTQEGETALYQAVIRGSVPIVRLMLSHGAYVNVRESNDSTLLIIAAEFPNRPGGFDIMGNLKTIDKFIHKANKDANTANLSIIQLLLSKGIDINAKGPGSATALMIAAYLHREDVVKMLLAHGADVNAKDESGDTALMRTRSLLIAKMLLSHGADVNVNDNKGQTAVSIAQHDGRHNLVKLLTSAGAR